MDKAPMSPPLERERPEPVSTFTGHVERLKDLNMGFEYYAIAVPKTQVEAQLVELEEHLGQEAFEVAVSAKAARDGEDVYHITIVRPPELLAFELEKGSPEEAFAHWRMEQIHTFMEQELHDRTMSVDMYGAGRLAGIGNEEGNEGYFAVAHSEHVLELRADLDEYLRIKTLEYNKASDTTFDYQPLGPIHLHATLGFKNKDVHASGAKDLSRLWE